MQKLYEDLASIADDLAKELALRTGGSPTDASANEALEAWMCIRKLLNRPPLTAAQTEQLTQVLLSSSKDSKPNGLH